MPNTKEINIRVFYADYILATGEPLTVPNQAHVHIVWLSNKYEYLRKLAKTQSNCLPRPVHARHRQCELISNPINDAIWPFPTAQQCRVQGLM